MLAASGAGTSEAEMRLAASYGNNPRERANCTEALVAFAMAIDQIAHELHQAFQEHAEHYVSLKTFPP